MIDKLTKEQTDQFPVYVDKWTKIGLCTKKANRKAAEEGIREAYRLANLAEPQEIVWAQSPKALCEIAAKRKAEYDKVPLTKENMSKYVSQALSSAVGGQHDAGWLSFYDYMSEVVGLREDTKQLDGLMKIAKNAGWFIPYDTICFVCERHSTIKLDTGGRLHCEDGPALAYPDGWKIYAWHGVRVEDRLITDPSSINLPEIEKESNAEIRRVMITQYDRIRYAGAWVMDSGAEMIHQDDFGTLYKKPRPNDTDMLMVKVVNSTPEPDGTFKDYYIRVHPELRPFKAKEDGTKWIGEPQKLTARNAVASTVGLRGEEYQPAQET